MLLCRMFCESKPCIGGSNEFVFESTAHPKLRIFTVLCFRFPIWLVGSGTGQLSAVNCRIWWPKLIFLYQDKVTCPIGQAWYGSYLSVSHNYPSGTIGRELWWTLALHFTGIDRFRNLISPYKQLGSGNTLVCTQHCGYWWPGAKAPGHQ